MYNYYLNGILNPHPISTGCDRCATGGYHGNGQCNSENHTSLFLRKMATVQWQVRQNPVHAVSHSFSKCYSFISSVSSPCEKFISERVQNNGDQNVYSDGRV